MVEAMVRRAFAGEIPFCRVTADAAYGFGESRRLEPERADVFHVTATIRRDTAARGPRPRGFAATVTVSRSDFFDTLNCTYLAGSR
jgi:hypothetical protein